MNTIGSFLRKEREKKGLLLRQAAALDLDQAILSKIERNSRSATAKQLDKFIAEYMLNPEQLKIMWLSDKIYTLLSEEPLAEHVIDKVSSRIKNDKMKKHYTN